MFRISKGLIQLLKFKTWETRLFKMPCLETPHFQTRRQVAVASGLYPSGQIFDDSGGFSKGKVRLRRIVEFKRFVFHKQLEISNFFNFKSWMKLIYDTVDICNFVINEFNQTFDVQNMAKEAFQNVSFGNALFPNEALGYSCLWAYLDNACSNIKHYEFLWCRRFL